MSTETELKPSEQSDRYRRDPLGFIDEGLNFAVTDNSVKPSSIPNYSEVWGELFIDAAGGTNFKFHVEKGISFQQAREYLRRFVSIIQQRIDTAKRCPFYEQEPTEPVNGCYSCGLSLGSESHDKNSPYFSHSYFLPDDKLKALNKCARCGCEFVKAEGEVFTVNLDCVCECHRVGDEA